MSLGVMGPTRDLGPAIVDWGSDTLSEIFEETKLTLNSADAGEVFEAIHGGTPVDTIVSGYSECSVHVPMTRSTCAILATILPGGSNSGTTGVAILPSNVTGISMYDSGLPLLVKPIVAGIEADNGTWMRLEHTYPQANWDVTFGMGSQRVYAFTFKAHPDLTSGKLWSAGLVNVSTSY